MIRAIGHRAQIPLLFGLMALVGPVVRWLTWPPSAFERRTSPQLNEFVSDLVFLLWPTQSLGVIEVNIGATFAAVAAVSANVLLFLLVGILAAAIVKMRYGLPALYLVVGLLLTLFGLWGAGFSSAYLNVAALLIALLLYAIPFGLTARLYAHS
jgi:hypothetical protein